MLTDGCVIVLQLAATSLLCWRQQNEGKHNHVGAQLFWGVIHQHKPAFYHFLFLASFLDGSYHV